MIDIQKNSYIKYFLFGSLYFSEGLIKVISTVVLPVYFLEKGVGPELITLVIGLTALPMIIKFIWGGIVDYFIKLGRKKFIILGGFLSIICLFLLTYVDPAVAIIPFAFLLFIVWVGVGFLDVSSDALAIEITSEKERGKVNGSMFFGQNSGMAIGAILFPLISKFFSYNLVFVAAAALVLIIIIFPLLIKENKRVKKREKMGAILINEFKKKSTLLIAFFAPIVTLSTGLIVITAPIYMNLELHLDQVQVGLISAVFTVTLAFGSLLGGILADRFGRKKTLYVLIGLSIFFVGLLVFTTAWDNFLVLYSIIGLLQGGYSAAYLTLFMDATNPKIGATQFSIFTSLGNLGQIGIATFSGTLLVLFGSGRLFLFAAWIFGPALIILNFIRLKNKKIS